MGSAQLKQEIHRYVDSADEQLLKLVYVMMKEYEKNSEEVGTDPVEGVITKDKLIERAQASAAAISEGKIRNIKDVMKAKTKYNAAFVAKIKAAEESKKEGRYKVINAADLWK